MPRILTKGLPIWAALMILIPALSAVGQDERMTTHQAVEIEGLVNKAAEILESHGRTAFPEFRRKDSPWRYDDIYLFVVDMQGVVLFNAAHPNREGRDTLEERDANGKQFHRDFVEIVSHFGSGWVDYMFPRPHHVAPEVKWSYVCATTVDGVSALVGAGVYVD
ncbi:cache domain-containing protein [Methylobacterium sp. NEAU K]|uniref:cache domain-containing protein n=1 Tax=Methylobacterium sp. NEAU K TaxID=3064946 RepID=UPI0027369825|nr:cache domain-containing protein [Methylobacterium sp. NEAU K]MDP4005505.1 cache domain-containing protein [Methylobacterium sp. NEAU K]